MRSHQALVLVGLPGVGKSAIGRRLARLLGRPFFDTDQAIEDTQGRTVAELFAEHGESHFRQLEHQALKQILREESLAVVATGGGTVLDERSRELLRDAFTVYLRSEPARLVQRLLRNDKRPLFRTGNAMEKIEALHAQREPFYLEVAATTLDVAGRPLRTVVADLAAMVPPRASRDDPVGSNDR